jgi:hypothetical protein
VLYLTVVVEHESSIPSQELPADDIVERQAAEADTRNGCGNNVRRATPGEEHDATGTR